MTVTLNKLTIAIRSGLKGRPHNSEIVKVLRNIVATAPLDPPDRNIITDFLEHKHGNYLPTSPSLAGALQRVHDAITAAEQTLARNG